MNTKKGLQKIEETILGRKKLLEEIGKKLGVKQLEDWYTIRVQDFVNKGGYNLIRGKKEKLGEMLMFVYSEYSWKPWKFLRVPNGFWKNVKNQRNFMEDLAKNLGYKEYSDWSSISQKDIIDNGGSKLLQIHKKSMLRLFKTVCPEYKWESYMLAQCPRNYLYNNQNLTKRVEYIGRSLGVHSIEDWYSISFKTVFNSKLNYLIIEHKGLWPLLKKAYPDYPWRFTEPLKQNLLNSKSSDTLLKGLNSIFPLSEVCVNYVHPILKHTSLH